MTVVLSDVLYKYVCVCVFVCQTGKKVNDLSQTTVRESFV